MCAAPATTSEPIEESKPMMMNTTLEQLRGLRLQGMAAGLSEQLAAGGTQALSFEERLALLVERELHWRSDKKRERLLKEARLKRVHLIEKPKPRANTFSEYFRLNKTLLNLIQFTQGNSEICAHEFSFPLIKKLLQDASNMGHVRATEEGYDHSITEQHMLMQRFGSIPH